MAAGKAIRMTDPLPAITADLAAELARLPCRVSHGLKDIERCPRCAALARWEAYKAIVQLAGVAQKGEKEK
jgi:hypothetical protein